MVEFLIGVSNTNWLAVVFVFFLLLIGFMLYEEWKNHRHPTVGKKKSFFFRLRRWWRERGFP